MLQFLDVHKSYGHQDILHIPSLQLEKGIYWIKGVNGSGKTTLLRMVAGLITFHGDILYNGTSLKKQPLPFRRQVSWAAAEPLFPEFVRGRDLVALYCNIRKIPVSAADELLSLLDMNDYIGSPTGTYSSGMIKKLALVLSLLGKPALVILDEPLITLDTAAIDTICSLVNNWHQQFGIHFLLSSHLDVEKHSLKYYQELTIAGHTIQPLA